MGGMKKFLAGLILVLATFFCSSKAVLAEECGASSGVLVNPVSKNLIIDGGGSRLDETFTVQNQANKESVFKIYAAPYSDGEEKKDFESETTFTQLSRWIKFLDASGGLVDNLEIRVAPCAKREVSFRVFVPDSIPDGGQYAVIFVESKNEGEGTITSSARVGMLLYGHVSGGKTIDDVAVTDLVLERKSDRSLKSKDGKNLENAVIYGGVTVTNNGNIDVGVESTLTVRTILGREVYNNTAAISLLPGSVPRKITDIWDETPGFGLFIAEYTVKTASGVVETATRVFFIVPLPVLLIIIAALIVVIIGVVKFARKAWLRRQKFIYK